jgi:cytochrome P450
MPAPRRPPGPPSYAAIRAIVLGRVVDADFFTRVARAHPRIAYVRVGAERLYILSHPDLARQLLIDAARHSVKSRGLRGAQRILGNGLLTSEGELHRRQRRLISPAFRHERVVGYRELMARAVDRLDDSWQARVARGAGAVDMAREMSALAFEVAGLALFGDDLRAETADVRTALAELTAGYNRSLRPWFGLQMRAPTPLRRRVTRAETRLDAVVDRIIDRRQRQGPGDDLLTDLLWPDEDPSVVMSPRQVRDEVMTLMLAGHETTAAALTFAWYLLARHPEEAEGLRAEAAGDRARAVIAETMRLYPPAWMIGRRLTADIRLDQWRLPAGATALTSQWVLHRDPRFWDEALAFRPQRWLTEGRFDDRAPGAPRGAYFPFGAGARMCVGEEFAWAETTVALSRLVARWSADLPAGFALRLRPAVTLRPRDGLPMTLRRV